MEVTIAELREKEISEAISVLYTSFGRPVPGSLMEEVKIWEILIRSTFGRYFTAKTEDNIIGICGLFFHENVCSIGYMGVLPEYRSRGIGTRLFDQVFNTAKDTGCETIILYASRLGKPIYLKYGFQGKYPATMYQLPNNIIALKSPTKSIHVSNDIPDWILEMDREAVGYDRKTYLTLKLEMGAKVLSIRNKAYGLLSGITGNKRIGPLISYNDKDALKIIHKAKTLGAVLCR